MLRALWSNTIVDLPLPIHLLAHRRSTSLSEFGLLFTLFVDTLGDDRGVLGGGILGGFGTSSLKSDSVSLVLDSLRSNKSLDLGGLGVWLATVLGDNLSSNDKFTAQNC